MAIAHQSFIRLMFLAAGGACSTSVGQASPMAPPVTEPSTEITTVTELSPPDFPGKERGDREKDAAEAPEKPAPPPAPDAPIWEWDRLTGNWWGWRTKMEEGGLAINGSYTFNMSTVFDGGTRSAAGSRSLLNINATLDLETFADWKGAKIFLDFNSSDDRRRMGDSGAFQGSNYIEMGRNIDEIGELWFEQKLFDDVLRFKLGKIDANSEFAFVNGGADFLNLAASASPTVLQLPTIPAQAVGAAVFVYPLERLYIGTGYFDGATQDGIRTGGRGPADFFSDKRSDNSYWIGEIGYGWTCDGRGDGRVAAGVWHATGDFARFDSATESGTEGFYALAEQQLWRKGDTEELEDKGIFAFAQFGSSDEDVSVIRNHVALGAALRGVCEGRPDDGIGLYVTFADCTSEIGSGCDTDETAVECYYKCQITPWMYVQPDIQFFANPSGRTTIPDAWVGSVQVGITF